MPTSLIESDLDREFREFHAENPQVFALFTRLAVEALESGERVGARCIWECMRWHYTIRVSGEGKPKLNDHHTARYARLLAQIDRRFEGFFEFRRTA